MKYTAGATMEHKTDSSKTKLYYPVIKFSSREISDSFFIDLPQKNRYKALKVASKYIKDLKSN